MSSNRKLEQSIADEYINSDPAPKYADYVHKFGLLTFDSIVYNNESIDKIKAQLEKAIHYIRAGARMYSALDDIDNEDDINDALIKIYENAANRLYEQAQISKAKSDNKVTMDFFKLAEKYYTKCFHQQIICNEKPSIGFHLKRLSVCENLVELDPANEKKLKESYVRYVDTQLNPDKYPEALPMQIEITYEKFSAGLEEKSFPAIKKVKIDLNIPHDETKINKTKVLGAALKKYQSTENIETTTVTPSKAIEIFNTAINDFLTFTKNSYKGTNLASRIILQVARIYDKDASMRQVFSGRNKLRNEFIQSIYESAAALNNTDAINELAAFRLPRNMWGEIKYRIPAALRIYTEKAMIEDNYDEKNKKYSARTK